MNRFTRSQFLYWAQRENAKWKRIVPFAVAVGTLLGTQIPAFAVTNNATNSTFNALSGFQGVVPSFSGIGAIVGPIARVTTMGAGIITMIAIAVTVIMVGWGGIEIGMGGGQKKQLGLERVKSALWGLIVAVGAGVITGIAAFLGYALFGADGLGGAGSVTSSAAAGIASALIAAAHIGA